MPETDKPALAPAQGADPSPPVSVSSSWRPVATSRARWGALALLAALIVGLAAWTLPRIAALESEATRRLQVADQRVAQLEAALAQAQAQLRDTQARTGALESRVLEAAGLQAQLEKLYRSLAEDSTDVLLGETESALALASQQLALGSHPQAALGALRQIDARLARHDDPSLGSVRRALLRDIDRLQAYPAADVGALAVRLDGLLASIDQLPLLAGAADGHAVDAPPTARPAGGAGAVERSGSVGEAASRATDAAVAGLSALRDELMQLFRVRRIDTPDAALVAPEQAYFLRQNLRLLLLNARLALLSRNENVFRADLERAAAWLRGYYDLEHRAVAAAVAQLRQMLGARLVLEPLTLGESLAAVRAARALREARP